MVIRDLSDSRADRGTRYRLLSGKKTLYQPNEKEPSGYQKSDPGALPANGQKTVRKADRRCDEGVQRREINRR